jgi:hypothetical protein
MNALDVLIWCETDPERETVKGLMMNIFYSYCKQSAKGLLRGELLGAKLDEKKESVFKTAERCAATTCFGDAFSCNTGKLTRDSSAGQNMI